MASSLTESQRRAAKVSNQRRIGCGKSELIELLPRCPAKRTFKLRRLVADTTAIETQVDRVVIVLMDHPRKLMDDLHGNACLFETFAHGRNFGVLLAADLATRKLPQPGEWNALRPPADKHVVSAEDDCYGD